MTNKIIYLKSLVKNFKPKTESLPKEILKELKDLGIDLMKPKVQPMTKTDVEAGRNFILNHTEEFLHHVVDYSLDDKLGNLVGKNKFEEKI